MSVGKAPPCVPTWRGHVETTKDALLIFEACFNGTLAHCFRRPHDRERASLIVSGNVFVYEEATSGIKRWTDGIPWSPSRILTNFLIYRQLNSPFPPGEKKRATKRSQRTHKAGEPYPTPSPGGHVKSEHSTSFSPESPGLRSDEGTDKDGDRTLVGSLIDSYEFKKDGLLKKTMTVTIKGVQHHLVSYYSLEDAKHRLKTPRDDAQIKDLPLRPELVQQQKFKVQNLDDAGDGTFEQADTSPYSLTYPSNGYDSSRPFLAQHQGAGPFLDSTHYYYQGYPQYVHASNGLSYAASNTPTAYDSVPPTSGYSQHHAPATSSHYAVQSASAQYQPQPLQQQQQQLPLSQQQYQRHPHPQHQVHATSPRGQQVQSNGHRFPIAATLPRPNGNFDMRAIKHDINGTNHSTRDSFSYSAAPLNASGIYHGIPQMPAGYMNVTHPYATRADGASQPYQAF